MRSHPYKNLYKAGKTYELQVRVEGINITVRLDSGDLVMKGGHVLDWFVCRFPRLMIGYCSPPSSKGAKLTHIYTKEQMMALKAEKDKIYQKCKTIFK